MFKKSEKIGCFTGIGISLAGILLIVIQVINSPASFLWVGIGLAVLGLGGAILMGVTDNCIGFVIGFALICFGIYFSIFKPIGMIPINVEIPSSHSTVEMTIDPLEYQPSDRGTILLVVSNTGDEIVESSTITVDFPPNFLEGFIIDYPTIPKHNELKDTTPLFGQSSDTTISFSGVEIMPNETFSIEINLLANEPGDFSGDLEFSTQAKIGSKHFGHISEIQHFDITVFP